MVITNTSNKIEQIITEHIPLVKYIASKVIIGKVKYVEYEDLVGSGMIGLMDAANKFDESRGMKFSTYASIRIKGSMIDELRRNSPISKVAMEKLNKYNRVVEELQTNLLRDPSDIEIAEELNISMSELSEIDGYINYMSVVSLESMLFLEDQDISIDGIIEDIKSPSPEKIFEENEQLQYLTKGIETLNDKDKTVLSLYYFEGFTLKEIGKVLEVSESRVCQLHSRAIMHLKKALINFKYIT